MGRKRQLPDWFLSIAILCLTVYVTSSCIQEAMETEEVTIRFRAASLSNRSADPDENKISDISLMIFDINGDAEECIWLPDRNETCKVRLIKGKEYIFCACANFGYQVYADHIDELEEITYYMAYPDEFHDGIPMAAMERITIGEADELDIHLEKLMAKISIRMDRSRLSDGVEMNVRGLKIGNCPKSARPFARNAIKDSDDCFPIGFYRNDLETDILNRNISKGLSGEISVYMLENMQGKMNENIKEDSQKVFDADDPRRESCSFIEMEIEYLSESIYSTGKGLIYRFYLGEDLNDLNVERNCHYHITVSPEDDGLSEDSWRVDKSLLHEFGPPMFKAYPSAYIQGDIGDKIHIWCEFSPWNAPFDVGISDMEYDKERGIYDYVIDEDGHGALLTLTRPGRGQIYMEAGDPINEAALFIIEVNLP